MMRFLLRTAGVALALVLVLGRAEALTVGYFTDFNAGTTTPAAAITTAGHAPVQILDISTFDLSTIDMLMIDESDNGGLSGEMSGRLAELRRGSTQVTA